MTSNRLQTEPRPTKARILQCHELILTQICNIRSCPKALVSSSRQVNLGLNRRGTCFDIGAYVRLEDQGQVMT